MILAQQIFEDHRKFVLSRIHADALPWTGGKTYPSFDDLEQEVWQAVARRIGEYIDQETPLAWLKVITHATVIDHFRRTWAKKRGTNVTRPLDFDPVNPNSPVLPPAKPTYASDEDDPDPAHERSETVGRKMKR